MEVTVDRVQDVDLVFRAPPSKSYTHRALIAAALAEGRSVIRRPLAAGDIDRTIGALRALGIPIEEDVGAIRVDGCGGILPDRGAQTIDLGNSGTSLRFLASVALLAPSPVRLTGSARMQERPVRGLMDALRLLGAEIRYLGRAGYPPVEIAGRLRGGSATIDAGVSSQYISSILMAGPCAESPVELVATGPVASASYLAITLDVMRRFGARVERDEARRFLVVPGLYRGREYTVEGDHSSASYLLAIAAVAGGRATVTNLNPSSVQGDAVFPDILERMGCTVTRSADGITVTRSGPLHGVTVDLASTPDIVQTLAVVAAFAGTPTRITGIGHLRHKESDRIRAVERTLGACGIAVDRAEDALTIYPGRVHGATIDPADDHRTAMAAALLGLGAGGVTVRDAACVSKSFPGFWDRLREGGVWNGSS
jgi:3-phosphoshikimate 1-carboxyvinyltransferase